MNIIKSYRRSQSGKNKLNELKYDLQKNLHRFIYNEMDICKLDIITEEVKKFFQYEMTQPFSYVSLYANQRFNLQVLTINIKSSEPIYGHNMFCIEIDIDQWRWRL